MSPLVRLGDSDVERAERLASAEIDRYGARAGTYGRNDRQVGRALIGKLGEIAVERWFDDQQVRTFPLYQWPTFANQADLLLNPTTDPFRDRRFNRWLSDEEQGQIDAADASRLAREAERTARVARRAAADRERYGPLTRPSKLPPAPSRKESPGTSQESTPEEVADPPAWVGAASTLVPSDFPVEVKTWKQRNWPLFGRSVNAEQMSRIRTKAAAIVWCRILDQDDHRATIELMGWNSPRDITDVAGVKWSSGLVGQWQLDTAAVRELESASHLAFAGPLPKNEDFKCPHGALGRCCFMCALPNPDEVPQVRISAGSSRFFHHPDSDGVVAAHGNWMFTAPTWTVPVTDVVESLPACPWCFPRSIETSVT